MIKLIFIGFSLLLFNNCFQAQNCGLLSINDSEVTDGYTLVYPHNQPNVFLLNNCGQIVHKWSDDASSRPGNTAYLLPNGNLVKTKRPAAVVNDTIWAGGGGATIEIANWDGEVLWSYTNNNGKTRLHHDICILPNGNIIAIEWEKLTKEEAINYGRDTSLLSQDQLWPDNIIEINPLTNEIVWKWRTLDHIIQDYDASKPNYGVISEHPELINFNYDTSNGAADWMHTNAIDFNADLNQIMISVPPFNEIWLIDHSTSTSQAASHKGGLSNRGGDLMYRIGNPAAYGRGNTESQTLHFQHDAHWANDLPIGHPDYGKIVVFNNQISDTFSTGEIFSTPWNMYTWSYDMDVDGTWLPKSSDRTIYHPGPRPFVSSGLSSVQILPNNNILLLSGRQGYFAELNPDNEIVWEYIMPLKGGNAVPTSQVLNPAENQTFRIHKYLSEYTAFDVKDLSPIGFIELNPDSTLCQRLVRVETIEGSHPFVYPNPSSDFLWIGMDGIESIEKLEIIDHSGQTLLTKLDFNPITPLDISQLNNGIFLLSLDRKNFIRFIKM